MPTARQMTGASQLSRAETKEQKVRVRVLVGLREFPWEQLWQEGTTRLRPGWEGYLTARTVQALGNKVELLESPNRGPEMTKQEAPALTKEDTSARAVKEEEPQVQDSTPTRGRRKAAQEKEEDKE
jgi:hypothetical protein